MISGDSPVTWRQFYAAYERALGIQSVVLMATEEIHRIARSNLRSLRRDPRAVLKWRPAHSLYEFARRRIGESFWKKAKQTLPAFHVPSEQALPLCRAHARVRIDKARRLIGYEPLFDFDRGMSLTAQFIKWANL